MQASDIPSKFPVPWANSAGSGYTRAIPEASQIGITNGAASLADGFPPLTFLPTASGGVPPFGQDTNGVLKQITQWLRWAEAGAPVAWDSSFSSAIGGYPNGAIVASATTAQLWWLSTADNNTTNPDSGGAGWTVWQLGVASRTGALTVSTTLTAASAGVYFNVGSGTTQTVPAPSAATGLVFGFYAVGGFTLSTPSGQFFGGSLGAGTVNLSPADWIHVQSDGSNWRIIGCAPGLAGSANHAFPVASLSSGGAISAAAGNITASSGHVRAALGATGSGDSAACAILGDFPFSASTSGYQELPSGLIMIWGNTPSVNIGAVNTVYSTTGSFPTSFPNGALQIVISDAGNLGVSWSVIATSSSGYTAYTWSSVAPSTGVSGHYIAIGH